MAEIKNIPELRFPEFTGKWNAKKFGELYTFKPTNSFSRDMLNYESGSLKNIHYGDIHTKFNLLFDIDKEEVPFVNSDIKITGIVDDYYVQEGDLILADASEDYNDIGKSIEIVNLNKEKIVSGLHTILSRQKTEELTIGFMAFLMKTYKVRLEIMRIAQGTKVLGLSSKRLAEVPLWIPKKNEQEKIATFLTVIDKRISLLTQQKEQLERYKKGLMQKIFSRELRFKDENRKDFPEWEEKRLGEIGTFQTSSIDKLTKENESEVYLVNYMNVYRHENINNKSIKNFQVVTAKSTQIESCNLIKGDILFTPSSETPEDIGHSVVIFEDLENAVFSYHLMRFRPKIQIDILYSHYFCNIPSVLNQLSKLATGSTRFTISVKSFSSIVVKLPSLQEQIKIATFLSKLDNNIELITNQINESTSFKKGLLQKLFV